MPGPFILVTSNTSYNVTNKAARLIFVIHGMIKYKYKKVQRMNHIVLRTISYTINNVLLNYSINYCSHLIGVPFRKKFI